MVALAEDELRTFDAEQRVLDALVALARRCEDRAAAEAVDAVLAAEPDLDQVVPAQVDRTS